MYGYLQESGYMEMSIDSRPVRRPRSARPVAALGRWTRDARAPSLRLTPAEAMLPAPDLTAPFTTIPSDLTSRPPSGQQERPVIHLRQIHAREMMPFMGRESACPYLEFRSNNRRCLSADPAPVSLRRQAQHCFGPDHRTCSYYRQARGLPAVPPTQAAFYTAAAVVLAMLLVMAGMG
jgi:hypothetical protein